MDPDAARPRVIVDGMNVMGSRPDGWWRDRDGAVRRMLGQMQRLASGSDEDFTLVLDGRPLRDLEEGMHDGVRVAYARRGGPDAADDRIVELVRDDPDPASTRVVTSDADLRARVGALGATTEGARSFRTALDHA